MPKTDILTFPAPRGILAVSGAGYYSVPTLTGGAALTPGTNAYGAYVALTAGEPRPFFIIGLQVFLATPAADVSYAQVGLGIGVAAAETQVSEFKLQAFDFVSGVGGVGYAAVMLPFPIPIAGGMRVAARAALQAGTTSVTVSLIVVAQGDLIALA